MQKMRRSPLWAKLLVIAGAVLLVASGGVFTAANLAEDQLRAAFDQQDLFGDDGQYYGEDVTGPVNILLAGLDTRPSRPHETPRSDAIMIVHVPESMDKAYLMTVPRDTLVEIPPYQPAEFPGTYDRIAHAMYAGADPLAHETQPDVARGFALLSQTVSALTGIARFDAGAVINFSGFTDIVDALGSITVELDEPIVSLHRHPDGTHRPVGCGSYCGEQMVYEPGVPPCREASADGTFECDLEGWQALDVSRQRDVEGGDYGRQQNQQVVMEAMLGQAFSRDLVTDPRGLSQVIQAAGGALIFDGRGNEPIDFAFALRHIRPSHLVHVSVQGEHVQDAAGGYAGEELTAQTHQLFAAVQHGTIDEFLAAHPEFVE